MRAAIFLASAAAALWLTSLLLDGFKLEFPEGLIAATVVFALAQAFLSPLVEKLTQRHADALLGGVGILSTFVALLVTVLLGAGLTIEGLGTWAGAILLVWLITAIATWVLPGIFGRFSDKPASSER